MSKAGKISLFVFLLLLALVVLMHVQARRVLLALVEAEAGDEIETTIGGVQLIPFDQILVKDLSVSMREQNIPGFRKASFRRLHLEIGSLWAFFFGGTLVVDKMECEGGELVMARIPRENDTTAQAGFNLNSIFDQVKNNAIRFSIKDMSFRDFGFTLLNDGGLAPTVIEHFEFRAHDLYLSADSILKQKPRIEYGLPRQHITIPNGPATIDFDTLFFSTFDNSIQINGLEVSARDTESASEYRMTSDKVRVAYVDFESLYTKGIAIVDSVFLGKSELEAKVNVRQHTKTAKKKKPADNTFPHLLIRDIMISQLAANVQLRRNDVESSFAVTNSAVAIQELEHNPDSPERLSVKNFEVLISDYETLLDNKSTSVKFDTVKLSPDRLALLNFSIIKADEARPILQAPVFELRKIDWYRLLFFKTLIADEAIAVNPKVNTTFQSPKGEGAATQNLAVLEAINGFLDVKLFSLRNASANLRFDGGNTMVTLGGADASVLINRMIESRSLNEALEAVPVFSFRNFTLTSKDMTGKVEDFSRRDGKLHFRNIAYTDSAKFDLKLHGLNVDDVSYDIPRNTIGIQGVTWQSAEAQIKAGAGERQPATKKRPDITLSMLRGANTDVRYSSAGLITKVYFNRINTDLLQLGEFIAVHGLDIEGHNLRVNKDSVGLTVKTFSFADDGSTVEGIRWNRFGADTLDASVDRVSFITDFNLLARQQILVPRMEVTGLKAVYSKRDSARVILVNAKTNFIAKDLQYEGKKFVIGSFGQTIDSIYYLDERRIEKKAEVIKEGPMNERFRIRDQVDTIFNKGRSTGILLPMSMRGTRPSFKSAPESGFETLSTIVESGEGGISISLRDVETYSKDSSLEVLAKLDTVRIKGIDLQHGNKRVRVDYGAIHGLLINSGWLKQPKELLRANYPTAAIANLKLALETDKTLIRFDRFDYNPFRSKGNMKGLEIRPLKDRQAFLDASFFQTNFIQTRIENISFENLDTERYLQDSTIDVRAIRLTGANLNIGKDKTHPYSPGRIKLLPTNSIQKLGVKVKVDSLQISNGHIDYTERSKVTSKEGLIHLADIHGLVRNIRNVELKAHDSLFIDTYARFLDSASFNLRVRESYQDSLAGFLMTTHVSPFHTSILNPVLVPLVSVEFQSGFIDTMQMHAIGREHVSLGKMKFLYHDLKVNFLDQNDTSRHSIKNYILKFAANNLVIRTNNTKRIGEVFEVRDRHRAVFQYWVKMILSGVTTSVGAKSNRSQTRKYLKELNTRKLPPIEEPLTGF